MFLIFTKWFACRWSFVQSHSFSFSSFHKFHSLRFKFQSVYSPVSPSFVAIRFVAGYLRSRRTSREKTTEMLVQLRANVVSTTSNLKKKFENNRIFCNLMHRTATWNIRPMSRKSVAASTSQDACLAEKSFARINCIPPGRMRFDRSEASIGFQAGRNPAVRYDWKGPARYRGRKGEKATKRKNASSFDDGCTRRFFFFPFLVQL